MNRKYFAYAIIAILIAFSIGMFAISVHFSSAPVEAQEVPTEPPASPPSTPDSLAPPSPPPVRTEVICAGFRLDSWCDRSGYFWDGEIDGDDPYLHYISCAAGHKYWSCNPIFRRRHANCRAPAPRQTTTQTVRQTSSSQAQSPSQSPSQNPPASPPQSSCTAPTLTFKKWVIGQSATDFPTEDKPTTFITNEETSCDVEVQVTYNGSQPPNTCELTGVSFTVTMSHGFTVSSTKTVPPSGSGFSKVWTYRATLTGDQSNRRLPRNHKKAKVCDGERLPNGPDNSDKLDYPGRYGKPIEVKINATGTYSGGTVTLPEETVTQDQRDGIRQEYVDYNHNVIPARTYFKSGASSIYNWGHYHYLIDEGLQSKRAAWAGHAGASLVVKSGYRHPWHNFRCAKAQLKYLHGLHQYGCALDVSGDLNGNGTITKDEQRKLVAAGKKATGGTRWSWEYGAPGYHVHTDWRPTNWIPADGTTTYTVESAVPPPSSSGDSDDGDGGDDDDSGDSGGGGDTAPAAPSAPTTPATPKTTPTTPTRTPTTVACGNTQTRSNACIYGGRATSRTAHRTTCAAGHTYWGCNRNGVAIHSRHTTSSGSSTRRSSTVTCGNTQTRSNACIYGGRATSRRAHRTTCAAGHEYWGCNRNGVAIHSRH